MRLATGLCPNPLGSYSAPQTPSHYKGKGSEGSGRKGLGMGMGRKWREGKDVKGYIGRDS